MLVFMRKKVAPLVLRRPAQVAALASPVRAAIVDVLATAGPRSIRELAQMLAQRPEALYHHVRHLVKHKLVIHLETRKHKRRPEAVYALAAPRLLLDRTQTSKRYLDAVAKVCDTLLRATARDYRRALQTAGGLAAHKSETLSIRRLIGTLDDTRTRRLKELLKEIESLFQKPQSEPTRPTQGITIVLTPM